MAEFFDVAPERLALARRRHECAARGPYATVCTESPGHRYSHYDAIDDSSWQDDWPDILDDDAELPCGTDVGQLGSVRDHWEGCATCLGNFGHPDGDPEPHINGSASTNG